MEVIIMKVIVLEIVRYGTNDICLLWNCSHVLASRLGSLHLIFFTNLWDWYNYSSFYR